MMYVVASFLFIYFFSFFQILASLFVLSVVAEPEAEPQHHTAGFTAYTNGALVPQVRTIFRSIFFLNNVTVYSTGDWSNISILEPSFDMALFQYFLRFTQICKKFAVLLAKLFLLFFLNNLLQKLPCQMMAQVSK